MTIFPHRRRVNEIARAAGRVLVGGFEGTDIPDAFATLAKSGAVGGAILFSRNFSDVEGAHRLVGALHALETPKPLWISIDQEGGRVARLKAPFPTLPPMRTVGEARRKTLAHKTGALLGELLSILGFHQDYAPVLDVDSNPDNPIIGDRAFSREAAVVARLGAAFIDGMQSQGIAACGKHFPGHGDTDVDSHLALPRLPHDLERLMQVELVPFVAAARVNCAAIMTAHVVFSAIDEELPATLSDKVIEPILRGQIGFGGVIVSDDLEMKAVADHFGVADSAVRAIRAGCDQLLICSRVDWIDEAHRALIKAVETGALAKSRLLEAASRVDAMNARFGPQRQPDWAKAETILAQADVPDFAGIA